MHQTKNDFQNNSDTVRIIAITGGIGSGKTVVAKIIEEKGYPVIYTDLIAKDIITSNEVVKKNLITAFGNEVFDNKGLLNNKYLSLLVFNNIDKNQDNLLKLNSIVHPPVIEEMIQQTENLIAEGKSIIFIESALVFEAALDDGFDYIVCVTADDNRRIERTTKRSGLSSEEILQRMKSQTSQEQKISLSDFTIENNKTLDDLKNSVEFILPILTSLPPNRKYEDDGQ